jgi:UDP-N-acetylglucosamine 2-epimerase
MKIVTVVGARPQFVKASAVSRELRKSHSEILVHTGQHYDENMSDVFFDELGIPSPDFHLGIGSNSHGAQTGLMLAEVEKVILTERPDWVLVYGDTNSTLAGALAAAKLHIPVAHVEAGLRSFNRRMPEEINRVLTDHVSDLLLCPSETAVQNLAAEGINRGTSVVGDVMYDAIVFAAEQARIRSNIIKRLGLDEKGFLLTTVHRAENTDNPECLMNILSAFDQLQEPLVFPVHPRTRKYLDSHGYTPPPHVILIDPIGYLDMVRLEGAARMILTDSGGIQKEAYWLGIPCITLRDETEWVETIKAGWNVLVGANTNHILTAVRNFVTPKSRPSLYGNGFASKSVVHELESFGAG